MPNQFWLRYQNPPGNALNRSFLMAHDYDCQMHPDMALSLVRTLKHCSTMPGQDTQVTISIHPNPRSFTGMHHHYRGPRHPRTVSWMSQGVAASSWYCPYWRHKAEIANSNRLGCTTGAWRNLARPLHKKNTDQQLSPAQCPEAPSG